MTPNWQQYVDRALQARRDANLLRQEKITDSAQGVRVCVAGKTYLSFTSNDYLGLANHPSIIAAQQKALTRWGNGAGASHLLGGHLGAHQQLIERLCELTGRDDCLLFSSGFVANTSTIQALVGTGDFVVQDKYNHASLLDGGLHSGATQLRYQHLDSESCARQLARTSSGKTLLVSDGVFSMDGDIAPLTELSRLAAQYQALLMVDDAHGFGCVGPGGAGSVAAAGLSQTDVPVYMATLGKALGVAGAFVAGSRDLISYLRQFARGYVYSTAIAPAQAAAVIAALDCLRDEPWRQIKLQDNIDYFRQCAAQCSLPVATSVTAIQWLAVHDDASCLAVAKKLAEIGVLVAAVRRPTVPTPRLRITLSAAHSHSDIDQLISALAECAL